MARIAAAVLMAALLAVSSGCGAGLVTAASASDSGGGGTAAAPALSLDGDDLPLVPPALTFNPRQVVVTNLQLSSLQDIRVEIEAQGVVDVQDNAAILSSTESATVIGFFLETDAIQNSVSDATAADIPALVRVVSASGLVAPPLRTRLLRQPRATLIPSQTGVEFVSVDGTSTVSARLESLRLEAEEVPQFLIATLDPNAGPPQPGLPRAVNLTELSGVQVIPGASTDEWVVTGTVPPSMFPGPALLLVQSPNSGRSTPMFGASYEPVVQQLFPPRGSASGGERVALAGSGLVPLDFSTGPATNDFDEVQIQVTKGGRTIEVPGSLIRTGESGANRLVFDMPPSPDGRSGSADITVVARALGVNDSRVIARVTAEGLYTYGDRAPLFAPRGAPLDTKPLAIAAARLEDPTDPQQVPDLLMLGESAGRPQVQLYLAEENGLYTRSGKALVGGDPLDNAVQNPVTLLAGDFDGDGVEDGLAIQAGFGTQARHLLFRGAPAPSAPLQEAVEWFVSGSNTTAAVAGDFDGDGTPDVALLRDLEAAGKRVTLHPSNSDWAATVDVTIPSIGGAVLGAIDADQDGALDVLIGGGGASPSLQILPGDGLGGLGAPVVVDLSAAFGARVSSAADRALGVWPILTPPGLGIALSGDGATPGCTPLLAFCPADPVLPRVWNAPQVGQFLEVPADPQWSALTTADLEGDQELEVLALGGAAGSPLRFVRWQSGAFVSVPNPVQGLPSTLQDASLLQVITAARQPGGAQGSDGVPGVLLLHEERVDGFLQPRLSTLLVQGGVTPLESPQVQRALPGEVLALAPGRFLDPVSATDDLVVAAPGSAQLLRNDGLGELTPEVQRSVSGLLPSTVVTADVPTLSGPTPAAAWLRQDPVDGSVQLEVWLPSSDTLVVAGDAGGTDLRSLLPANLQGLMVAPESRVVGTDVDLDGAGDLVVLLRFDGLTDPGEGDGMLLICKGVSGGSQPLFTTPATGLAIHGRSADVVAGEFTREKADPNDPDHLELMVAVLEGSVGQPGNGNHLRAYRVLQVGSDLVPQRSFGDATRPVLAAGSRPERLRAIDMDANGFDDVLVASGGDRTLRALLNDGLAAADAGREGEVELGGFREAATSPQFLAPGSPVSLGLLDADGDGALDVLVNTFDDAGSVREPALGLALGSGNGGLGNVLFLPRTRTGSHSAQIGGGTIPRGRAMVSAVGLFNSDGRADVVVGFSDQGGSPNLRLLFGTIR